MTFKEILDRIPIPPLEECGTMLNDKLYRLKTFYYLLEKSAPTYNAEKSLKLINNTLNDIEDCHSGVPKLDSPSLKYHGRMYPVQEDYTERKSNGSIVALTKGNKIIIEPSGEFQIISRLDDEVILNKLYDNRKLHKN